MNADDPKKPSNAQTALLDYYDDMLGSLSSDPLKELANEDRAAKVISSPVIKTKNIPQAPVSRDHPYAPKLSEPRKKMQAKKLPPTFYDEVYEEKLKANIVSPLIIPAAFPKLAPKPVASPKQETVPKQETAPKQETVPTQQTHSTLDIAAKPDTCVKNNTVEPTPTPDKKIEPCVVAANTEIKHKAEIDQSSVIDAYTETRKKGVSTRTESVTSNDEKHKGLDALPENGRPVWAQERFECLLFSVAGLKLAVPLISLGAIYKIESHFTPLVGRASWFMGLYRHDDRNVRLVDTAQLVMPDRVVGTTRENYKYIIRLGGNNWGMACDSVQESISIEPEEIKWRTERSKRAWLSGTVIEHMCALIDVEALTDILKLEALSKHSAFKA